jgi:hypothetical protein
VGVGLSVAVGSGVAVALAASVWAAECAWTVASSATMVCCKLSEVAVAPRSGVGDVSTPHELMNKARIKKEMDVFVVSIVVILSMTLFKVGCLHYISRKHQRQCQISTILLANNRPPMKVKCRSGVAMCVGGEALESLENKKAGW